MSSESGVGPNPSISAKPGLFGNLAFTVILVASSLSNVGVAMYDTATSWLMTNLNPDPMMVSAVQIATTLPMFLLTLPAGALADIVDPRRLLIGAQTAVFAISVAFAFLVSAHLATPAALLATSFALGATGALAAPGWLMITPMLVAKEDLDSAIAINNTSFNISRAVGPALGGFAIAAFSIDFPYWCYCAGNLALLAAIWWWRAPRRCQETLPAERLTSAVRTGLRYVRHNRAMDSTLIRAVAFFPFASAYWALLPLVARSQMHNGPAIYGALLGMIGAGSIIGSFGLNWLKERLGPDRPGGDGVPRHDRSARDVRGGEGAGDGAGGEPPRRRILDHHDDDAVRVGAGGASRLGARPRTGDFPLSLFRVDDPGQRRLGQVRQPRGSLHHPLCRSRGRLRRHDRDDGAESCRPRRDSIFRPRCTGAGRFSPSLWTAIRDRSW